LTALALLHGDGAHYGHFFLKRGLVFAIIILHGSVWHYRPGESRTVQFYYVLLS
jgi:hypothetical protein